MRIAPDDSAYLACQALCEGLVAGGVTDAVVSPGLRSMPLALTVDATDGLRTWVRIDERSAAFFALGLAKASARPVVLVCTSGTAATNYLPAVAEAHYGDVPLIVVTADRPPELRGWGAGQTIDQHSLYGSHVRWFCEAPVPSSLPPAEAVRWFGLTAARAVVHASGADRGPVHLNVPFREPLEPLAVGERAAPEPIGGGFAVPAVGHLQRHSEGGARPSTKAVAALAELARQNQRGVVVAGPMWDGDCWAEAAAEFCRKAGWPLLAEPASQLRRSRADVVVTNHHDLAVRTSWADAEPPTAVVRIGGPPTCKPLRLWIERHRPELALVDPAGSWTDPSFTVSLPIAGGPELLAAAADELAMPDDPWATRWATADAAAAAAIDHVLDGESMWEAGVARQLGRSLPAGHALYVANSMPVRDIDSFLRKRSEPLAVHASRGASGIDGLISAAAGVAAAGTPTTVLIGDLAFRHDLGGLIGAFDAAPEKFDLTVVLVDNGGGTIFSFLPAGNALADSLGNSLGTSLEAALADSLGTETFDRMMTTPPMHRSKEIAAGLARSLGIEHQACATAEELADLLSAPRPEPQIRLITIDIDAEANRRQHDRIAEAVEGALAGG